MLLQMITAIKRSPAHTERTSKLLAAPIVNTPDVPITSRYRREHLPAYRTHLAFRKPHMSSKK